MTDAPRGDERLSAAARRRLVELGRCGVGGYEEGDGGDLVHRVVARTAADLAPGERWPWRDALAAVHAHAAALAACEAVALSPGPLGPRALVLAPSAWIAADALVAALAGRPAPGASMLALGWTPPEQAAGAPWDAAANRYVVALLAYRLIAGELPFGGAGLRHALAAGSVPPPFSDEVARAVRPGVQALVLAALDPDPARRCGSAAIFAAACARLLAPDLALPEGARPSATSVERGVVPRDPAERARARGRPPIAPLGPSRERRRAWGGRLAWTFTPVAAAAAALAAGAAAGAGAPALRAPTVRPAAAVRGESSEACASCHAREVAEWRRSVMAHAASSPLFGALESVVEEQIGRDARCPSGAGVLRAAGADACRDPRTGVAITGAGGAGWCTNCHAPAENLRRASMPAWRASAIDDGVRAPAWEHLAPASREGVTCLACHAATGPAPAHARARVGEYEGNATWTSARTGEVFVARPEDRRGVPGIANAGYALDPRAFFLPGPPRDAMPHALAGARARDYARSSEACGGCHDVRLFGTDAARGEPFKRLRNAFSEWRVWADTEAAAGRTAPTCQGCHMSLYPGVCAPSPGASADGGCPAGTRFSPRPPGARDGAAQHYFTSVDVPMADTYPDAFADEVGLDAVGLPLGLRARRDLLLAKAFRFELEAAHRAGVLEVPVTIENVGAGHRVPAGFSQEREVWVELVVRDGRGAVVYEVGRVATADQDLRDKRLVRVTTRDDVLDARGRPIGVFGADVVDGPDAPRWFPNPARGGTHFRGLGLVNLQNGFLRCVRCIGVIDARGDCQPAAGQGRTRADRYEDGVYEAETGACHSNLAGGAELFETYFPVGSLDADRGDARAPDAIIDTRSAPPGVPITYTYVLDVAGLPGPFHAEARLRFRAFPPYLVRAFAEYEAGRAARGLRPSGPQVRGDMVRRLDVVDIGRAEATTP